MSCRHSDGRLSRWLDSISVRVAKVAAQQVLLSGINRGPRWSGGRDASAPVIEALRRQSDDTAFV